MLIAWAPLLVALVGLLLWALSSNPKVSDAGRILFAIGAFWFVYQLAGKTIRIG
jgi:hypothetical protein